MVQNVKFLLLFFCIHSILGFTNAQHFSEDISVKKTFFSSQFHLQNLYHKTHRFVTEILLRNIYFGNFSLENGEIHQKLRKMVHPFIKREFLRDSFQVTSNPINAYKFLKALTVDLPLIGMTLKEFNFNKLSDLIDEIKKERSFPTLEDLIGAAAALVRIIYTYNVNLKDIAVGKLAGHCCSEKLDAHDFFILGQTANLSTKPEITGLLYEFLLKNYYYPKYNKTFDLDLDLDFDLVLDLNPNTKMLYEKIMANSEINVLNGFIQSFIDNFYENDFDFKLENIYKRLEIVDKILSFNSGSGSENYKKVMKKVNELRKITNTVILDIEQKDYYKSKAKNNEMNERIRKLCQGKEIFPRKNDPSLKCSYVHKNEPFLILNPYKEEIIHVNPNVILYHDFLSSKEVNYLIDAGKYNLEVSTVLFNEVTKNLTSKSRVSKTSWTTGGLIPNRRISHLTGLNINSNPYQSEDYQIVNYGLAGHYDPHYDCVDFSKKNETRPDYADRFATFLIFLSDVQAGGATIFPYLGLSIKPEKGMGLFWYNLYDDLEMDDSMIHGGCPVLMGSKWISNKWIRGSGQNRHCGLKSSIKHKI